MNSIKVKPLILIDKVPFYRKYYTTMLSACCMAIDKIYYHFFKGCRYYQNTLQQYGDVQEKETHIKMLRDYGISVQSGKNWHYKKLTQSLERGRPAVIQIENRRDEHMVTVVGKAKEGFICLNPVNDFRQLSLLTYELLDQYWLNSPVVKAWGMCFGY
jgi:hypothetical protein